MSEQWNETRLLGLISSTQEENTTLEYKGAPSLKNNKEIRKDVSAMANSAGGTIIYGMKEKKDSLGVNNIPDELEDVSTVGVSKETLDQIIAEIPPRIENFHIQKVECPSIPGYVYVVDVPQSHTAHMADDKRYHKRFNFHIEAMEDYEVRDVMNRSKDPKFEILFSLQDTTSFPGGFRKDDYELLVDLTHVAGPIPQNFQIHVGIPWHWLEKNDPRLPNGFIYKIFSNYNEGNNVSSPIFHKKTKRYSIRISHPYYIGKDVDWHNGEIEYTLWSSGNPIVGQINKQILLDALEKMHNKLGQQLIPTEIITVIQIISF